MLKKYLTYFVFVLFVFLSSCKEKSSSEFRIEYGSFQQTVTETGELEAVNARTFVMPRFGRYWYEMKIIGLLEHGTAVQAGDSLIYFDPSEIKKFIIDRETNLETQRANLEKTQVEIQNRKSDIRSSLLSEQAAFDLKKLQMEQFRFESEKVRKVNELEFKQAELRLEKAKQSAHFAEIIAENQLNIQKIRVRSIEQQVNDAYAILPELVIRTPIKGIFQIATKRRSREMLQIGEEVSVGNRLGSVPDLTWMKVNTVINEADFMKVSVGQSVMVRLDAMPDKTFEGEVTYISKLCRPIERDARQKVFDVIVELKVSDERLKPGMTVSCEFICNTYNDILKAPLQCVGLENGRHYVYIDQPMGMKKQEVKAIISNNTHMVIEGNIEEGQRLVPIREVAQRQDN